MGQLQTKEYSGREWVTFHSFYKQMNDVQNCSYHVVIKRENCIKSLNMSQYWLAEGISHIWGDIKWTTYEDCFLRWQVLHHIPHFPQQQHCATVSKPPPHARVSMATSIGCVIISWTDSTKCVKALGRVDFGRVPSVPGSTQHYLFASLLIVETMFLRECVLELLGIRISGISYT